jgi:hypothetical protein
VVEEAAEDEVVLVTNNKHDFGAAPDLASELAQELTAEGIDAEQVRLANSIRDAVRLHVGPSADARTRVQALLRGQAFRDRLYEAVNESVLLREVSAPEDDELSLLDVSDVQIVSVQDLRDIELDDAYEVDDNAVSFNFGATIDAEVDFHPYKYEIASADVPGVHVSDWDWNESVVLASKTVEFTIEATGDYNSESDDLAANVWSLE